MIGNDRTTRALRSIVRQQSHAPIEGQISRRRLPASWKPSSKGSPQFGVWGRLKKVDGSAGSSTERCSWAYDFFPLSGLMNDETRIAEAITDVYDRANRGRYLPAADGSVALAVLRGTSWLILVSDEAEETAVCNSAPIGGA